MRPITNFIWRPPRLKVVTGAAFLRSTPQVRFIARYGDELRLPLRRVTNGFLVHIDANNSVVPAHLSDALDGNEDVTPGQPVAGIDDQKSQGPVLLVEDEIFNVTDRSVDGLEVITNDCFGAPQMRI